MCTHVHTDTPNVKANICDLCLAHFQKALAEVQEFCLADMCALVSLLILQRLETVGRNSSVEPLPCP